MCDVEGAKASEMTRIDISCLPEEMLRRIFKLLTHEDLMNVLLVCKSWKMIGQDPALWTLFVVKVKTQGDIRKLAIPRLQKIQTITLEGGGDLQKPDVMTELFQAILAIPSVTKIGRIWTYDLRSLEPRLCISVMARLKIFDCGSELTKEQLEDIFTAIAEGESKTEGIYIDSCLNIHSISPHLFASAVTNVRELVIHPGDFQDEKFQAMFKMIKDDSRCLKKVRISMTDYNLLASIEPEVFGSALNSLEDVVIEVVRRGVGHDWKDLVTDILQKLVRGDSKLKTLKLSLLTLRDIAELDPELVRQAREKVGQFWGY